MEPDPQSITFISGALSALPIEGLRLGAASLPVNGGVSAAGGVYYAVSLLVFVILSAFFSGSETALFSLTKIDRLRLDQDNSLRNRLLAKLYDQREELLNTLLLGNNFANIGAALSGGTLSVIYLGGSELLSFLFGAVGVTTILIFFGEVIPKSISVQRGVAMAKLLSPLLIAAYTIIMPIQVVVTFVANFFLRLIGISPRRGEDSISDEEMKILVTHGSRHLNVEEREMEMIGGVLELSEADAEEIMTPRTDLVAFEDDTPQEELLEALRRSPHSRVLIYNESLDNVTGVLHVKDVLLNPSIPYMKHVRDPLFVPPKKDLYVLLLEFRSAHTHVAVVVDEFGGVAGIVTLNDLLEEIFGKLEEKESEKETLIIPLEDGSFKIQGKTDINDINEELRLSMPEEKGRTMSGYIMNQIGHVPESGESFTDEWGEYQVLSVHRRRIMWVRFKPSTSKMAAAEARKSDETGGKNKSEIQR